MIAWSYATSRTVWCEPPERWPATALEIEGFSATHSTLILRVPEVLRVEVMRLVTEKKLPEVRGRNGTVNNYTRRGLSTTMIKPFLPSIPT